MNFSGLEIQAGVTTMTERNINVVEKFVNKDTGYTGYTTSSQGDKLYSYNACIAEWDGDKIIVNDGWDGYSPTTSKHFKFLHDALEESDVEWEASHTPINKGKHKPRWY